MFKEDKHVKISENEFEVKKAMTFKIESNIETETITYEEETQTIDVLSIEVHTDYPNEQIKIILDDTTACGTQTDSQGVGRCSTGTIQDYHVIVNIHDETFEDDIIIEE